ncbi:MAG: hypothetical protein H6502_00465 [Candidatus Woesearchaeota archaeon]|nr:MAG: hypothetical protein H6502_00465 [Candidatus Woesearchaeota archaeon]
MKNKNLVPEEVIRWVGRVVLLCIAAFWFVFALFSGAQGIGLLQNALNALPWLLLFVLVYVAWKWELTGGIIIACFGVFTFFFFNAYKSLATLFLITLPIILLGFCFITSWFLRKNKKG